MDQRRASDTIPPIPSLPKRKSEASIDADKMPQPPAKPSPQTAKRNPSLGKIYGSKTMTTTFAGPMVTDSKEPRRNTVDLEADQRRYSVQCVTEYQKMPHRPSLYGYPPPSTKLNMSFGGSIEEEPRQSLSQLGSGKLHPTEENLKLGREPVAFRCQTCQQPTLTVTTYHVGAMTWIAAVLIFLCGGILGCFLIPFFTNCCKDVKHTCPVCETEVGTVKCI